MKIVETIRRAKFARDEAGAALIEFALFITVFLLIAFGIIESGYAFYRANSLTAAVREGARWAAVQPALTPSVSAKIDSIVWKYNLDSTGTKTKVSVIFNGCPTACQSIKVRATYPYNFKYLPKFVAGTWPDSAHATATFRWEMAAP